MTACLYEAAGRCVAQGGSTNWTAKDTDGDTMNSDPTEDIWHNRTVDLSSYAGKTVDNFYLVADAGTPVGSWNIYYGEIAIYSADGTVTTIYDRAPSESFSYFTGGGETNTNAYVSRSKTDNDAEAPEVSTTYYVGNQVGSTEMTLAAGGWPVAQDMIYPYGMEPSPSVAPNRYRFAGMERDATSGLDHTPYRQYAALMGRWMTPDPYNGSYDLANPQSFNRYLYVNGNPLAFTDPSGLQGVNLELSWPPVPPLPVPVVGAWYPENLIFSGMFSGSSLGSFLSDPLGTGLLGAAGPLIELGLFGADFLNDIFGWWGQGVQFNGNVAASQSGKNVPQISSASTNGTISSISRAACASMIADSEYSIAAHTSGASPDNPIVQTLLGNGISGLYNLWNAPNVGAGLKALIVGGFNPGIPGGAQVLGYPIDSGLAGIATQGIIKGAMANVAQVSAETVSEAVGGAKFAYDFGAYLYAYARDCSQ